MNVAYLVLGGNLGDRESNINSAEKLLLEHNIEIQSSSSVYETAPWGMSESPDFLNKVIKIKTDKSAFQLISVCLSIEQNFGRIRGDVGYKSRKMDIDILFFNDEVFNTAELAIPHPRLHERKFVLVPFDEIAPDYIHPVFRKSIRELLTECRDLNQVKKYK
ncbi:MAG: 2-amino-4-hydroxy-6-hydroxymethyldihydropteridine diphosphokinase [Bacteroidota bacterium]